MKNKVEFEGKVYFVAKPSVRDENNAKLQQSKTFNHCIKNGCCLRVSA